MKNGVEKDSEADSIQMERGLSDRATGYIFGASLGFKKQHLVSHIIGFS